MRPRQQIDAVGADAFHRCLADAVREARNQLVCMTTINMTILRTVQFDLFLILVRIWHSAWCDIPLPRWKIVRTPVTSLIS